MALVLELELELKEFCWLFPLPKLEPLPPELKPDPPNELELDPEPPKGEAGVLFATKGLEGPLFPPKPPPKPLVEPKVLLVLLLPPPPPPPPKGEFTLEPLLELNPPKDGVEPTFEPPPKLEELPLLAPNAKGVAPEEDEEEKEG